MCLESQIQIENRYTQYTGYDMLFLWTDLYTLIIQYPLNAAYTCICNRILRSSQIPMEIRMQDHGIQALENQPLMMPNLAASWILHWPPASDLTFLLPWPALPAVMDICESLFKSSFALMAFRPVLDPVSSFIFRCPIALKSEWCLFTLSGWFS